MTSRLLALAFVAISLHAQAAKSGASCGRACLEGFVNRYLDAMVAHDPSHLPVTPSVKFTEDDVALKLGDGLWDTASGRGIALARRLKIENQRISEAESVVVRSPRTFDMMEKAGAPDRVLLETVPESERLSRTQLTAIANQYFEAIEQGNGKVAPFDADCNRFENGMKTSGALGCSAQLDT